MISLSQLGYAYTKFGSRRGFRVHSPRKFCVQRLRARIVRLFRTLSKWRRCSSKALRYIKRGICKDYDESVLRRDGRFGSCRKGLVKEMHYGGGDYNGSLSFARSNSFYSEAIKDCLEFIKRTSVSVERSELLAQDN